MNEKNIQEFTLSSEERARMRNALHNYVAMKPVHDVPARSMGSAWMSNWIFSPRPVAAALVVALFASTAGISYAAEDALPGDALYTVKTNINEPVQGALAVSAQAKSDWAITVASTRLQEAATLAAEGKLSTSTQEALKENFDAHAQQAAQLIAEQASTSPDTGVTTAVSFEAQLAEYQRVLTQVGIATDSQTESLASAVQQAQTDVGTIRASAQAKVAFAATTSSSSEKLAASRMRDIAREQLKASLELASSDDGSLATSSAAQVAMQLNDASNTISQGDKLLADNSAPAASGAFQNALSAAQKLSVFLKTSSAIHAKTGLTIGDTATSTNSHRAGAIRTLKAAVTSARAAMPIAAPMTLSASATSSTATSTDSTNENTAVEVQVTAQTTSDNSGEGSSDTANSDSKVLPLSVPDTNTLFH